jgi:hypothetical protein
VYQLHSDYVVPILWSYPTLEEIMLPAPPADTVDSTARSRAGSTSLYQGHQIPSFSFDEYNDNQPSTIGSNAATAQPRSVVRYPDYIDDVDFSVFMDVSTLVAKQAAESMYCLVMPHADSNLYEYIYNDHHITAITEILNTSFGSSFRIAGDDFLDDDDEKGLGINPSDTRHKHNSSNHSLMNNIDGADDIEGVAGSTQFENEYDRRVKTVIIQLLEAVEHLHDRGKALS